MERVIKDVIQAESAATFPTEDVGAKERVLTFLRELQKDDPKNWTSIKTISEESKVSSVYLRHIVEKLIKDKTIERATIGRKQYFRLPMP